MPALFPSGSQPSQETTALSVAELDRRLRSAVEGASLGAWVQGEVRGLKIAASGHAYFTLKDENQDAMIEAVAYRDEALRARRVLCEGARVLVRGKATVWAPRGRLQFVVEAARPAGRGALLEALERLKEKLRDEGLFDPSRKLPVPHDARRIGVVTSKAGAVIHDIIRVAFTRGAPSILLSPASVQGDDAPRSIVAALARLQRVRGLDVIIVGRGGGSFEDLMPFNDERVIRQIASCTIPIVSAVGHEVDVTLTDLVADARAATPSQAAELVVADKQANVRTVGHLLARMRRAMISHLREDRAVLRDLGQRLGDPKRVIEEHEQRLDDLMVRARDGLKAALVRRRAVLERLERRMVARHPQAVVARTREQLLSFRLRMVAAARAGIRGRRVVLQGQGRRLEALSPLAVLARGYAMALGPDGHALLDAGDVGPGAEVQVRLRHGRLSTKVLAVERGESESRD
jgi:exodeoxyribonuclease VII large subunit